MRDQIEALERDDSGAEYRERRYTCGVLEGQVRDLAVRSVDDSSGPAARLATEGLPNGEFTRSQTHNFVDSDHLQVMVTSDGLGWTSAYVSRHRAKPCRKSFRACPHPLVSFALNGPVPVSRILNGIALDKNMLPGSFGIVPSGTEFDVRLDASLESLHIYVRQALIEEMAAALSEGDPAKVEIKPQLAAFDPLLEQLAVGLCEAAARGAGSSRLYVDHLGAAFAARLLEKHSSATIKSICPRQGLNQRQMKRVREFVEANLDKQLTLADLARESNLSSSHFARLFKKSTGLTPYQYVMRRRIERAQRLLVETSESISRIAINCGFAHQVHLTQAFRRLTGTTPAAFRKKRLS